MKLFGQILINLFLFNFAVCQNSDYISIVENYCNHAKQIEWENQSQQQIINQITDISNKSREDSKQKVDNIKTEIKKNNPSYTQPEIELEFSKNFTTTLVRNCPEYIALSKTVLPESPKSNLTLSLITEKIDSLLFLAQDKSYVEQFELAEKSIFNFAMELREQVDKDFEDGIAELATDVGFYLMHHSKYYYPAYLVTTQFEQLENSLK